MFPNIELLRTGTDSQCYAQLKDAYEQRDSGIESSGTPQQHAKYFLESRLEEMADNNFNEDLSLENISNVIRLMEEDLMVLKRLKTLAGL